MIRILTIHHKTDVFLQIQKKYIERYTTEDYVVYCGFSKFNPPDLGEKYKNIGLNKQSAVHCDRLNYLKGIALPESDKEDILIFMDSDTFPVSSNWVKKIRSGLSANPICAIQRKENSAAAMGCKPELHPHICFLSSTVNFWLKNKLTIGGVPNTAYNIGKWLKKNKLDFTKLLRSNRINLHPLYFGVYDNILYHHGSGNRQPYDGVDICSRPGLGCGVELNKKYPKIPIFNQKLSQLVISEINNDNNFIRNYLMGVK